MTRNELKKLSRVELLELLLDQIQATEKLQQELDAANQKLEAREINISKVGSIAQAALQINEVFTRAEEAAKQYYDNAVAQADKLLAQAKGQQPEAQAAEPQAEETQQAEMPKVQPAAQYDEDLTRRLHEFYQKYAWFRQMLDGKGAQG